jgi:hypothetical protein
MNIQWAYDGYPKDKIQKLNERKEKCKKLKRITKKAKEEDYIKLSYPANAKVPFVIEGIEVRVTEKFGRGIYATRDLKAGDIIAIDPSQIGLIKRPNYNRCCNCSKKSMFNLIPCLKTTSVMYCSEKCRNEIYQKFGDLKTLPVGVDQFLKTVIDAFGSRENLIEFLREIDGKKSLLSIFDFDSSEGPDHPKSKENWMKSYLSLYISQCSMTGCFHGRPSCNGYGNHELIDKMCKHFLYIICQSREEEFNPGILQTLINHSCDFNVHCIEKDNTWIHTVVKPIKAGEQLFRVRIEPSTQGFPTIAEIPLNKRLSYCSCYFCVNKIEPKDFHRKYHNFALEVQNKLNRFLFLTPKEFEETLTKHWNFITKHHEDRLSADVPDIIASSIALFQMLIVQFTIPKSCVLSSPKIQYE